MSDSPAWTERTGGMMAGLRRPSPASPSESAPTGPELVKSDQPEVDPFADRREYEAVRSILGRSHDACFLAEDGMPYLKPWAYFQGAEAHPQHRSMILHWPGVRIEVEGENLHTIYLRVMTRRADVWRIFDAERHERPPAGSAVIHGLRVVLEMDDDDA